MISRNGHNVQTNLSKIIESLKKEYRNIYLYQFGDEVFIYHSVGRRQYKELLQNDKFNAQDREEQLCKLCVVYPENYDYENCENAGLLTRLAEEIINNSYLTLEQRDSVMRYYKAEMEDTDNQVNCVIQAAFPTLKLEEIEDMDVVTAAKYLSRATWILENISGVQIRELRDDEKNFGSAPETYSMGPVTEEVTDNNGDTVHILHSTTRHEPEDSHPEEKKIITKDEYFNHRGQKKQEMTPEKLAELRAKYPEIPWEEDEVLRYGDGVKAINSQEMINDLPPALRPRNQL